MNTASGSSIVLRTAVVLALFAVAPMAGAAESLALEEIVVTATKVAQDIDSTPAAITAITAQNTLGVTAIQALPPAIVAAQIDAVFADPGVDAVKIGMLADSAIIDAVADRLLAIPGVPIVLDVDRTGLYTTGVVAERGPHRIALFFTGRQHAGENLAEVLPQAREDCH